MGRGQELLDAAREGDRRTVEKILGQIVTKRSGPFPSLRRGAGVNVQDDNGYTPLHHACLNGHREIVRLLLSVPASPCVVDKKGATPLHLAAFKGDSDVVAMLLAHNDPPCEVDRLTLEHESALLFAAQFGFVSVVAQLVARGADVTIKNKSDESALDLAAQYGKLAIVQHLIKVRPQLLDPYMFPASRKTMFNSTPLHRASKNGRKNVVKALLDAGIDPNLKSYHGTPLHEAAAYGQASIVRILLKRGADITVKDNNRKTIYDVLDEYPEKATKKVREVIREYESYAATYSDEDLPPFPVPDCSPTAMPKARQPKPHANDPRSANKDASINSDNTTVTNPHSIDVNLSQHELANSFKSLNCDDAEEKRDRTASNSSKNKYKGLQNLDDNLTEKERQLRIANSIANEIRRLGKKTSNASSNNELYSLDSGENLYGNVQRTPTIVRRSHHSSTNGMASSNDSLNSGSLKKRPKPLPKPPVSADYDDACYDDDDGLYVNQQIITKLNECNLEKYSISGENAPDDWKLKASADSIEKPAQNSYVTMGNLKTQSQRSTMISDYVTFGNSKPSRSNSISANGDPSYVEMTCKLQQAKRLSIPEYVTAGKFRSDSCHIKGDLGCMYNSPDYDYVYALMPRTRYESDQPFIKMKEKANPGPCYCHEDPVRYKKNHEGLYGKDLRATKYYSCRDISMKCEELSDVNASGHTANDRSSNDSENDTQDNCSPISKHILRKKVSQVKQVLTDWNTQELQKYTNNNDSLPSSQSSITKHHPQSFVKKFASKCLGLKAKFNSAPNISNSVSTEDVKSKPSDHKTSTNTLLIGNSKFFKMLSKKEESGDIVCNDEFDTISLDRLGTLNRDSVVNRSNRSCPGFKTSLPNISENNELSDTESVDSITITEIKDNDSNSTITQAINTSIFEPRDRTLDLTKRKSMVSNISTDSTHLVNECYESYEFSSKSKSPIPPPRPTVAINNFSDNNVYENIVLEVKSIPKPATRIHIPVKPQNEEKTTMYENVSILQKSKLPEPVKRTVVPPQVHSDSISESSSSSRSRSSTMSSDSMIDESNLEDILLSEKSKSFRHRRAASYSKSKLSLSRTQSNASNSSDITEASALENVDCSDPTEQTMYLSMTGTLPNKKSENPIKKKVLFRHKTFTNIEVDRNSVKIKDLPQWDSSFLKETLAHYHIRGTGHCIYKAPTVQEFIYIFNRDTLHRDDVPPFTKVPYNKRDSYFETAICFCRPRPPKFHNSAEDLLEKSLQPENEKVTIDLEELRILTAVRSSSFQCYCDSGNCALHSKKKQALIDFGVKFSVIKKSISTPDITLDQSPYSTAANLPKNKSVPSNLEEPYAVVSVEDIIARKSQENDNNDSDSLIYTPMSNPSTLSSARPYSIKDIAEVISLNDSSKSNASTMSNASGVHLPIRKSSSSEYSGHLSLHSCNSNTTIKSDMSFKSCIEESSDESDGSDGTVQSDADSSDAETVKSDISTAKRPWVHSDSFRFGNNTKHDIDVIVEENLEKSESGICLEGSEGSSSGEDSIPRSGVSLDCALLERGGDMGGVRSGRRRWDETEGTSEGDALSISSAASSCAPLHLHHHGYNKVSPTPPKKPPRRNLSVSPTHANSPSSGYSYELRPHARSQDDLDDIQGAKHYLKHGRSVDQYVDGKLSYSEYEENHNSPRVAPIPNPRPSLKQRSQPVAITAVYENVIVKEQNPRRKLRRNITNEGERMNERGRKYSNQERSSLESLLDDQSMNSPSDCERYYEGQRVDIPLSPTHYEQPPTPEHPPPSARQAENCIHERIRPLSQEYKRRSALRDSTTETDVFLLRAASAASVASGATDRSGNTDNCVEEYVCDVPFAGLFKGSTTTLDGIGLRPMPAERPKTLKKLKSVYDASPTEPLAPNSNGHDDEVRRRSNTTSSTQSGDKSLSILSPFDEQEEWAKISEIMASFGSKLVRESVFVSELEQEFTSRLGLSCSESSLSPSVASNLGLWLAGLGMHDYESLFLESGYDDIEFINGILDDNDLREMGIEETDRQKILLSSKQLPLKITEISNNHNNNIIKCQTESVEEWLRNINLELYNDTFRKHLYVDMDRVRRIWEVELTAVLEIQKAGHRKRILASVSGEHNGPMNHTEEINTDLNTLKTNIQQLKEEIKEKLPADLKPVPPPVVPTLMPPGGETLKRSKKNRPAPQPPRPSDLEIRAPSELLVGVPGALKTQWKHQPFVLVTGAVTYVANYLGSTVVKELRGTESTKKSIQKLKKSTKEPRDSPDIILSISYRGVKFLNTITRELVCEHEIRNIHCACQDADDLTHFAYITKDHSTKSHYCHVFRVATMDQATEVILTLGEAFEVAYQMALREQSNRTRVTQSIAKTPTHETHKEKPNHGRSHSITEIKLNGHQLKIAPLPASLSNEDFQAVRNDGSKSPRTPLLKAPIASTEEL